MQKLGFLAYLRLNYNVIFMSKSKEKTQFYIDRNLRSGLDKKTHDALLRMYDTVDEKGKVVEGYDKEHADRTWKIVMIAANEMGLDKSYFRDFEAVALLHDIGRKGMDRELFGKIFTLAKENGLPVRIMDIRKLHPSAKDSEAVSIFTKLIEPILQKNHISMDEKTMDHIRMRMAYKERTRAVLAELKPELDSFGINMKLWMEKVMLYYYYPKDIADEPKDVRALGMLLVACENFEAYNNAKRGRDYYCRQDESLKDAFKTIEGFKENGLISDEVMLLLQKLTASGRLDHIINQSRGLPEDSRLSGADEEFKRELSNRIFKSRKRG